MGFLTVLSCLCVTAATSGAAAEPVGLQVCVVQRMLYRLSQPSCACVRLCAEMCYNKYMCIQHVADWRLPCVGREGLAASRELMVLMK